MKIRKGAIQRSPARDRLDEEASERQKMALALRREGASCEQIAKQMGLANRGVVNRLIKKAIEDIPKENAEEVLAMELERLDNAFLVIRAKVKAGDLKAIDTMLKIMERRARYLGLDKPKEFIANAGGGLAEWISKVMSDSADPGPSPLPTPEAGDE